MTIRDKMSQLMIDMAWHANRNKWTTDYFRETQHLIWKDVEGYTAEAVDCVLDDLLTKPTSELYVKN